MQKYVNVINEAAALEILKDGGHIKITGSPLDDKPRYHVIDKNGEYNGALRTPKYNEWTQRKILMSAGDDKMVLDLNSDYAPRPYQRNYKEEREREKGRFYRIYAKLDIPSKEALYRVLENSNTTFTAWVKAHIKAEDTKPPKK